MTIPEYLIKLVYFLGFQEDECQIEVQENDESIRVDLTIPEPRASQIIGDFGQNLRAIRSLLKTTFIQEIEGKKLFLDINNYQQEKEQALKIKSEDLARLVLETGQAKTLYDLNSFERFLVHSTIANNKELGGVSTYSTSVGERRFLTICLTEDLPSEQEREYLPEYE